MDNQKKKYIISKEKRKVYNDNYMQQHKDLIHKRLACSECGATYTYFNKSRHNKCQRHLYAIQINVLQQKII